MIQVDGYAGEHPVECEHLLGKENEHSLRKENESTNRCAQNLNILLVETKKLDEKVEFEKIYPESGMLARCV